MLYADSNVNCTLWSYNGSTLWVMLLIWIVSIHICQVLIHIPKIEKHMLFYVMEINGLPCALHLQ